MARFELDLTMGELDVVVLVIALDFDVVTRCAKDVFKDSKSQLWWQA